MVVDLNCRSCKERNLFRKASSMSESIMFIDKKIRIIVTYGEQEGFEAWCLLAVAAELGRLQAGMII